MAFPSSWTHGNDELVEIVERLRDRCRPYSLKTLAESNELMSSAEEHLGILDAIFARDAAQAKSPMFRHREHVRHSS
jgi:DNA-binding GntR family transcriptional regulator